MKKIFTKLKNDFLKRPIFFTISLSFLISFFFCTIYMLSLFASSHFRYSVNDFIIPSLIYTILILPIVLTIENLIFLIINPKFIKNNNYHKKIEIFTLFLGVLLSSLFISVSSITTSDWNIQLTNYELHSPVFSKTNLTLVVIITVSLVGYFYCRFKDLNEQPPLATVLAIASMYLGVLVSILWIIQIWGEYFLLAILPINYIIIILKTIRHLVYEKATDINSDSINENNSLSKIDRILNNSSNWPWLGIIVMLPLLGILIVVLLLFGQKPDSIIRAWTETADWNLSKKIPPQNIYHDNHYLCTVAAGGHKDVVKPIREGKRHGHKVLVNRQLCVANAFEQIIEEKTPKFHKFIRTIYDKYGYPIATKIKSPYTADIIYFLMKPLEWTFLTVIYLVDVKPENRIAIQYPHSKPPKQ
ncbi:MAG: DUF6688 domain-containing protein [Sarcina sp.]